MCDILITSRVHIVTKTFRSSKNEIRLNELRLPFWHDMVCLLENIRVRRQNSSSLILFYLLHWFSIVFSLFPIYFLIYLLFLFIIINKLSSSFYLILCVYLFIYSFFLINLFIVSFIYFFIYLFIYSFIFVTRLMV
jgi:hypothetical protein